MPNSSQTHTQTILFLCFHKLKTPICAAHILLDVGNPLEKVLDVGHPLEKADILEVTPLKKTESPLSRRYQLSIATNLGKSLMNPYLL